MTRRRRPARLGKASGASGERVPRPGRRLPAGLARSVRREAGRGEEEPLIRLDRP
jgi:hypothetical protein